MKKRLIFIFLLLFLFPIISVKAAWISRVDVSGANSVNVGDKINLSFYVNCSGVKKESNNGMGIASIVFELSFDDSVFSITSASSNGFDTEIGKENGGYYVVSYINEGALGSKCNDGVLYCDNYVSTITFYVKDTDKNSSNIQIKNVNAILFNVGSDYNEKDAVILTSTSESSHLVNIKNTGSVTIDEPKSIVSSSNSKNAIAKVESKISKAKIATSNQKTTTITKPDNSNAYLSSLEIKNHKIDFNKDKLDYKIYVENNENTLDVKAQTENSGAIIEIIGADDLKKNNYKILVNVILKDGQTKTYTINAQRNLSKIIKNKKTSKHLIDKNIIKYVIAILCIILVTSLIVFIITFKKNKKLDKMLDNFDKF